MTPHGRQQLCRMGRLFALVALSVTFSCTLTAGWLFVPLAALLVALVETGVRERRPVRLVSRPRRDRAPGPTSAVGGRPGAPVTDLSNRSRPRPGRMGSAYPRPPVGSTEREEAWG